MLVPPLNKVAREKGFNELLYFNEIMRVPLSGLSVHVDKIKENPDEIVRVVRVLSRKGNEQLKREIREVKKLNR